jgi:hypothetical protein
LHGSHGFQRSAEGYLAQHLIRGQRQKNTLASHRHLAVDRGTFWQLIYHAVDVELQHAPMNAKALDPFMGPASADSVDELADTVHAIVLQGNLEVHSEEPFAVIAANSGGAACASAAGVALPEGSAGRHTTCWAARKAGHILTLVVQTAASYR